MNWIEQWEHINTFLESFLNVSSSYFSMAHHKTTDRPKEIVRYLKPMAKDIYDHLKTFSSLESLPPEILEVLKKLKEESWQTYFTESTTSNKGDWDPFIDKVIGFSFIKSQIDFFISKNCKLQVSIESKTELAFSHLKRLISVDPSVRKNWEAAWEKGETDLEKFGSIHLLHHGIWSFKAHSEGQRTDLITQELFTPQQIDEVERSGSGMVLTEWKTVSSKDPKNQINQAKIQLDAYSSESLYAFELQQTRYIILVSKTELNPFEEIIYQKNLTYRVINIPISPTSPSKRKAPK